MQFNYLGPHIATITDYKYEDFDALVKRFGYSIEKNGFLHKYYDWSAIPHFSFQYSNYGSEELKRVLDGSTVYNEHINFYVRLTSDRPLILINSINLGEAADDLCFETGMGWEAISTDGRYILEFTDSFQELVVANFYLAADK